MTAIMDICRTHTAITWLMVNLVHPTIMDTKYGSKLFVYIVHPLTTFCGSIKLSVSVLSLTGEKIQRGIKHVPLQTRGRLVNDEVVI